MIYYVSKVFWLIAAPTNALVLISAIAAFWAVLRSPKRVAWLAAAVACGLVIGTFTPIGVALIVPLEYRFAFLPSDSQPPDGIILLGGSGVVGRDAGGDCSQPGSTRRHGSSSAGLARPTRAGSSYLLNSAATRRAFTWTLDHGRLPRTHFMQPSAQAKARSERWILVTSVHCAAVCRMLSRVAGFYVEPYPVEFLTDRSDHSLDLLLAQKP